MGKKYALVDGMNLFFRAIHTVSSSAGIDAQLGMALHTMLTSMKYAFRELGADEIIFCLDGSSWRKRIYPEYKLNRKIARMAKSEKEQEDGALLIEAFDDLCEFINLKTNMTTLRNELGQLEADDLIAAFIQSHPDDDHTISSTDQDFYQLVGPNVKIFNPIDKYFVKETGYFTLKGMPVMDKKTKAQKTLGDPDYFLFKKCIRGDKSDNIFSAYPGVRENGTKNKVGIREAFGDMGKRGYKWNNFMLQRWTDHNDNEQRVKERYELNKQLIDLTAQPNDIKVLCAETIAEALNRDRVRDTGFHFLKFCGKWDLKRIGDTPDEFVKMFHGRAQ